MSENALSTYIIFLKTVTFQILLVSHGHVILKARAKELLMR
jgi:hypothetical protein